MDTAPTFRRWLKRLRAERDITQDMLAELVGCSVDTIRAFESGRRRPSRAMAERLAEVLEISHEQQAEFIRSARQGGAEGSEYGRFEEYAPVSGLPARPQRLRRVPLPPTALIGRAAEEAELRRRLLDPACRLVTLTGAGGIGKTRLALQVAAGLAGDGAGSPYFADGVSIVMLATVTAADNVPAAIADALNCPLIATATFEESLLAFLHDRQILLMLDNFEHVLHAIPLLTAILDEAPGVRLLVTSRERLRLQGEQVFELGGLATPRDDTRAAIDHAEAVLLFLERARSVARDFALTPENRSAVATICRLVDGMPLGIELAAAWIRVLSPDEIAVEIARSLDFLTLSDRNANLRHRSMRAVLDHSWTLLEPDEQHVLARLSIFQGGCTREAAETVAGARLPVLAGLLDKSLVRRTPLGRYEMHGLVRQYAADRLASDPSAGAMLRAQHCTYYTDWLTTQGRVIASAQQHTAVTEIAAEIDNLRSAWVYAVDQRQSRPLRRISDNGLLWFYELRSWYREAELMCRRAADAFRTPAPNNREEELLLGTLTGMQGWFTFRCGQPGAGMMLLEESVRILRPGEQPQWLFNTLVQLGYLALFKGEFGRAAELIEEHAALAQRINNSWVRAHVFLQQAALHSEHDPQVAYTRFHENLPHIRAANDRYLLTMTLNYLGEVALNLGLMSEAEDMFTEARIHSIDIRNGIMEVTALAGLASVACAHEIWVSAMTYALQGVARSNEVGEVWSRAKALVVLGEAEMGGGDDSAARNTFTAAMQLSLTTGLLPIAIQAWTGLATLDLRNQACHQALLILLALVRRHSATNHRTAVRIVQLWTLIAIRVDSDTLTMAESRAVLIGFEHLPALLTAYGEGQAAVMLDTLTAPRA